MPADEALVAIVGGTGHLGAALARRWVKAGLNVVIDSRDPARAREAAAALGQELGRPVASASNRHACGRRQHRRGHRALCRPGRHADGHPSRCGRKNRGRHHGAARAAEGDAGAAAGGRRRSGAGAAAARGPGEGRVRLSQRGADQLATDESVDCDVLVFGDSREARARVVRLVKAAGLRGLHGGALINSAAAEALTSVLIFINKLFAVDGAGVRITGELTEPDE